MATVEELLSTVSSYVDDDNITCTVNPKKRTLTLSSELIGVFNDEKAERIYFSSPRYVGDNVDLNDYSIRINYINANNQKNQYLVTDLECDEEEATWTWLLSRNVTAYTGSVFFSVCAVKTSGSNIINEFNTTYTEATVLNGIEVSTVTPGTPEYDYISSLMETINAKYAKPSTGIPKTDLASDVQVSLGKADSAIQSLSAYRTSAAQDAIDATKANVSNIPTKTSQLTNDSGFITKTVSDLANYYRKLETYTKTEVTSLLDALRALIIEEAPNDSKKYVRQNKSWVEDVEIEVPVMEEIISELSSMIEDGEIQLPVATPSIRGTTISSDSKNSVSVGSTGKMTINEVGIEKISNTDGYELVLNGGTADSE